VDQHCLHSDSFAKRAVGPHQSNLRFVSAGVAQDVRCSLRDAAKRLSNMSCCV